LYDITVILRYLARKWLKFLVMSVLPVVSPVATLELMVVNVIPSRLASNLYAVTYWLHCPLPRMIMPYTSLAVCKSIITADGAGGLAAFEPHQKELSLHAALIVPISVVL
jgi:hypothetical protein